MERFSDWLPEYARRTSRLTETVRQIGFEVSAESSRRILRWLQITASGDTVLRIIKNTPLDLPTHFRVVGLDDWAIRKGHRYGSLIVDQETHRVVELIEGSSADDIQAWFKAHPEIEIVTRDRSSEYRKGLNEAAPQAIQIADRFHLLMNLRKLGHRVAGSAYKRLKQLPVSLELLKRSTKVLLARPPSEQKLIAANRQKRLDLYNEVQRLKQEGISVSNIALHLNRNYYTIRDYYRAETFPERMPGRTPRSALRPYVDYLDQRFEAGYTDPAQLLAEIQAQGYSGSMTILQRWLRAKRILASEGPVAVTTDLPITHGGSILPSNYKLGWLLALPPEKLNNEDQLMLDHVLQDTLLNEFYTLAQSFRQLVNDRDGLAFDAWLNTAARSPLKPVRTFAKGLRDEYPLIRAALDYEWSNGLTEGQVNRLKFIKRQMYGRASFALLRQKVLYDPGST